MDLYDTHQNFLKQPSCCIDKYITTLVNNITSYEYLIIFSVQHLTLTDQVSKMYKKVSSRLNLLKRIRPIISPPSSSWYIIIVIIIGFCSAFPHYMAIRPTFQVPSHGLANP